MFNKIDIIALIFYICIMNTAFIYPGQGSQYVGMGKDLYKHFPEAKEIYEKAEEILGFDLAEISFNGPEEKLKQTYITQPAIFIHSWVMTALVCRKLEAGYTAGHSLGEYTALVYAGALSFDDGLKLVKLRGELMQKAGEMQRGTMAAVIGLDSKKLEEICKTASEAGVVQVANFNSPGQLVISGSLDGVHKAMELARINKAKMVKELVVHGAFHSPLMEPAREELKLALDSTQLNKVRIPIYSNVSSKAITPTTPPAEIRDLSYRQLTSPVRWEESVVNMINDGAAEFIELGPGKVLQGLAKRINPTVNVRGFDKADDLNSI
jgi:[acyl-carrier-protein] S-malonyltransferase